MAADFSSIKCVSISNPTNYSPSSESESRLKSACFFDSVYGMIPSSDSNDLMI